jgi:hypothetical protein
VYISSSSSLKRPRLKSQTTLSAILLNCETPVAERSAPGCRIEPSHLPQHNTLLRAIRCNLATRRKAPPLLRLAPTGATACGQLVAASPSHPFLSSAPPHEYTQGASTGATTCGDAAAASPPAGANLFVITVPPQQYALRLLPQQYTLGAPTGATACGNAAAASEPLPPRHRLPSPHPLDSSAPPQTYFFAVSCFLRGFYLLYPNSYFRRRI